MLRNQITTKWNALKTQLLKTLTELKANHKDNWAVVKNKSDLKEVKILSTEYLEGILDEKKSLLQEINQRMSRRNKKELISPQDQIKCDQLNEEINSIQKELEWQELLKRNAWKDIKDYLCFLQNSNPKNDLKWDLRKSNERIDQLTDKLNWLRTLVRAGDIQQLQELVRQAKI